MTPQCRAGGRGYLVDPGGADAGARCMAETDSDPDRLVLETGSSYRAAGGLAPDGAFSAPAVGTSSTVIRATRRRLHARTATLWSSQSAWGEHRLAPRLRLVPPADELACDGLGLRYLAKGAKESRRAAQHAREREAAASGLQRPHPGVHRLARLNPFPDPANERRHRLGVEVHPGDAFNVGLAEPLLRWHPVLATHRIEEQAMRAGLRSPAVGLERPGPQLKYLLHPAPASAPLVLERSASSTASARRPPHRASIRSVASFRRHTTSTARPY